MAAPDESIVLSLLPAFVSDHPVLRRWYAIPPMRRGLLVSLGFAALVFVPWLGAVGFWDPWEGQYSEVARSMIVRDDYVYPYYRELYFFSKPVLLPWLSALGMNLLGIHSHFLPPGSFPGGATPSGVSMYTEWAVRLPIALLAITACGMVYTACARLASRRVGLFAAAILATMPAYGLLARQAITDMPYIALMTCGTMAFAIAAFDDKCHRSGWAYTAYCFLGFATLGKGFLGFCLTGAAFLAVILVTGDWKIVKRLRLAEKLGQTWVPVGPLVFAAIVFPWFTTLTLFNGIGDEHMTFAYRFFIWDNFKRLGEGVHTTTPGGDFVYFIEQLGFGMFPWVFAIPGAVSELARAKLRDRSARDSLTLLAAFWALIAYVLMSLSATKFHHYAFPALPGLAILAALWLDRVFEEGLEAHAGNLALGLAAFAVVGQGLWLKPRNLVDLYTYNYERPYPQKEIEALHPGLRIGPFELSMLPQRVIGAIAFMGGAAVVASWVGRSKKWLVTAMLGTGVVFAIWVGWFHWREMSPHWSQRDLFWSYLEQRGSPEEPIIAYYMNWHGETLYSRNLVRQIGSSSEPGDPQKLKQYVDRPGREWVIIEQRGFSGLQGTLTGHKLRIADRSSNKYFLVAVED
jgi:4-amino-4-deoxy-L-arabinose transferase-like glycosyltransferase